MSAYHTTNSLLDALFPYGTIILFLGAFLIFWIGALMGSGLPSKKVPYSAALLVGLILSYMFYHLIGLLAS